MTIQAAVDATQYHHQWLPDTIEIEPGFSPALQDQLSEWGYHFTQRDTWGAVEAIYIHPTTHRIEGGSDRRRAAGQAIG